MSNVYIPLLKKLIGSGDLNIEVVGFTTRSKQTADAFIEKTPDIRFFKSRDELVKAGADAFLICVNASANPAVITSTVLLGLPMLVETPIIDHTLAKLADQNPAIAVVEQWPYMPLEQFKERLYVSGVINRPYYVVNDCRSYDYHAIAQLRTYMGRQARPLAAVAATAAGNLVNHFSVEGTPGPVADNWDMGLVTFDNGAVLQHNFSYCCKTAPFRTLQTLRAYSSDGTVITGRMNSTCDDYSMTDINVVTTEGRTKNLTVSVKREEGFVSEIACDYLTWKNKFIRSMLSDNEIAIATHIESFISVVKKEKEPLYNIKNALMDNHIVQAIKYAAAVHGAVRF